MKFAEEFDQDHVPEWRDKYFDYKTGKRLIKAIQRAINRTNGVSDPRALLTDTLSNAFASRKDGYQTTARFDEDDDIPLRTAAAGMGTGYSDRSEVPETPEGRVVHGAATNRDSGNDEHERLREGSDVPSYPQPRRQVTFSEPDEAILSPPKLHPQRRARDGARKALEPLAIPFESAAVAEVKAYDTLKRLPAGFQFKRVETSKIESHTHPIAMLNLRKEELITFLHAELLKTDQFYQQKEKDVGKRLQVLHEQLHIMRARRDEELSGTRYLHDQQNGRKKRCSLMEKVTRQGSGSKSIEAPPLTPITPASGLRSYGRSDFARKPIEDSQIPYRAAKNKLRLAMQEYYRELEYLKSYSLLNRTAFRKLINKYERTLQPNARPTFRWFNENVDTSHFVTSNLVDEYIEAAEDLYTRYFERGNHKLAVSKLREITKPHGDKSGSALFNGLLVGVGLVFAVEGVWDGIEKLFDDDAKIREQTAFLLQIYAGYFLMLYLFSWFCMCCRIWTAYKVNYPFVFEFDTRNDLDWRQLSNFPCIFWFMFGVTIWFNFAKWWEFGAEVLFLWYPVMLIGVTLIIIFLPLPVLRWRSRRWFAIAHLRLFCAGFFPVEFRDFFLGDMYCSLVYAVANAELFFCLYITKWDMPRQCGSGFSRLMGALAALPPLWRAMQCIRRFIDTRNWFPHLANLVKYLLTIGVAIVLSIYRINNDWVEREIYILLAVLNSLYGTLWDLFMDFSLLQEGARHFGLRDVLAFDMPWMYYSAIVIDSILRFGWAPLVIFTHDLQRGTIVAFIVAFAEATRRGVWILFRVENEHCTNVGSLKASRDIPLPYKVIESAEKAEEPVKPDHEVRNHTFELEAIPAQSKTQDDAPLMEAGLHGRIKRSGTRAAISRMLADAHKQDFQKKRRGPEDETEEGALRATRRKDGIEAALQEDEESDGEVDEASDERELYDRSEKGVVVLERERLVASPDAARSRGR